MDQPKKILPEKINPNVGTWNQLQELIDPTQIKKILECEANEINKFKKPKDKQ